MPGKSDREVSLVYGEAVLRDVWRGEEGLLWRHELSFVTQLCRYDMLGRAIRQNRGTYTYLELFALI